MRCEPAALSLPLDYSNRFGRDCDSAGLRKAFVFEARTAETSFGEKRDSAVQRRA